MDFNFTQEQTLLADSLRRYLAKSYALPARRQAIAARQDSAPSTGRPTPTWACWRSTCRKRMAVSRRVRAAIRSTRWS